MPRRFKLRRVTSYDSRLRYATQHTICMHTQVELVVGEAEAVATIKQRIADLAAKQCIADLATKLDATHEAAAVVKSDKAGQEADGKKSEDSWAQKDSRAREGKKWRAMPTAAAVVPKEAVAMPTAAAAMPTEAVAMPMATAVGPSAAADDEVYCVLSELHLSEYANN